MKHREIFALLSFVPIRENCFILSGFTFDLFIFIHDWTEAIHACKPSSAVMLCAVHDAPYLACVAFLWLIGRIGLGNKNKSQDSVLCCFKLLYTVLECNPECDKCSSSSCTIQSAKNGIIFSSYSSVILLTHSIFY